MSQTALQDQVALVTGAGTGIGQATAIALAAQGAFVGVHYRGSLKGAQATLDQITAAGGQGCLLQGDLTDESAANRVVDELVARAGKLTILINNAGTIIERASIEHCTLDNWQRSLDANLTSAFLVTRRAIPHLRASGNAVIINNLSLAVQTGGANGAGPYAAAKGGLQVFTRTLARELAPQVRVIAVMPGVVETPHHEQFSTPERMADYRRQTPLGRNGQAAEVAAAMVFLCSPGASFISGALLDISGGRFLR